VGFRGRRPEARSGKKPPVGSSVKAAGTPNPLTEKTLEFWELRSQRRLSREDARQIAENVTGFFQILYEWESNSHGSGIIDSNRGRAGPCGGDHGADSERRGAVPMYR